MNATLNRIREKHRTDEGFTLIELLVVVVIIGVLVAIAVPVYLNYRKGAADKAAQSDLRGAVSAIEQFYTDNANNYPLDITPATTGTNGKVTLPLIGTGTAGVITLSDGTSFQFDNVSAAAGYIACTSNANGTAGRVYVYNSSAAGSGSVKVSTAATVPLCITAGT
jgi:type IV pilus assembly protein PilA